MSADASDSAETQRLLEKVRAGEPGAADQLFALHRPALSKFAELRLDPKMRQRVDSSDVVQEAQLEAYRRLPDYLAEQPMPFHLWIRRIAYDRLLMLRRRHVEAEVRTVNHEVTMPDPNQSSQTASQQMPANDSTPSKHLIREEVSRQLRQALDQLPERDREILFLRFFEGLSNQETAQVLGIVPATASQRYGRALRRLQKLLPEGGLTESQS
jgi:RNA polymerase sigma-70 factor (ECF subfamily)